MTKNEYIHSLIVFKFIYLCDYFKLIRKIFEEFMKMCLSVETLYILIYELQKTTLITSAYTASFNLFFFSHLFILSSLSELVFQ